MTRFDETLNVYPLRERGQDLPLVVEARSNRKVDNLVGWIEQNRERLTEQLTDHGALLFRGFDVEGPQDFEDVARMLEPGLQNEYLGTSPRENLTDYVFSASELPGYYPIPQHCEMTFVKEPPRRLFFCCLDQPDPGMGQTPLVDFREVYRQLDDAVLQRFIDRGIRIIRNYSGPNSPDGPDLWKLKRWDDMFGTTDREIVEKKCADQGFQVTWRDEDQLRLVHEQDAVREHPETGEPAWFNHTQVFHLSSAPSEFARIYQHAQRTPRIWLLWQATRLMVWAKKTFTPPENQSLHCTYADGAEIELDDMEHVRDVIWDNMVAYDWKYGDIVAIDNFSVSHGRLPYTGPRKVVVAWA